MNEEARTFGYLCPECGKPVMASRDPFTLAASDAAIACDCGGAVLRTSYSCARPTTANAIELRSRAGFAAASIRRSVRRNGRSTAPPR